MKKLLSLMLASLLVVSLVATPVFADMGVEIKGEDNSNIGTVIKFKGVEQKNNEINQFENVKNNIGIMSSGGGSVTYELTTLSSVSLVENMYVKYLTTSWAKSDNYKWTKTNTASLTVSGGLSGGAKDALKTQFGLSGTISTSYAVMISIPADSTRYSKLAFGSDFNKQKVQSIKVNKWYYNGWHETRESPQIGYYYEPTQDSYLYVKYK